MGEEGEGLRFQELKNAFDELEMKAKENQQFFEEMRERQKEEQRAQKEASSKLLEAKERELAILQSENEEMELELGRLIEKVNQQANQVSTIPSSPFIIFLVYRANKFISNQQNKSRPLQPMELPRLFINMPREPQVQDP